VYNLKKNLADKGRKLIVPLCTPWVSRKISMACAPLNFYIRAEVEVCLGTNHICRTRQKVSFLCVCICIPKTYFVAYHIHGMFSWSISGADGECTIPGRGLMIFRLSLHSMDITPYVTRPPASENNQHMIYLSLLLRPRRILWFWASIHDDSRKPRSDTKDLKSW
jgi:hypothetical protein